MKSHEVLKQAFDNSGISPKEIASELGVSLLAGIQMDPAEYRDRLWFT